MSDRDRAVDALVGAALKAVEQIESLLVLLDRQGVTKKLRELLQTLDAIPTLEHDLSIVKSRLRQMLSSDPDKTPRHGISSMDLKVVNPSKAGTGKKDNEL